MMQAYLVSECTRLGLYPIAGCYDNLLPENIAPALVYDMTHINETAGAIYAALVQKWLNAQLIEDS